MYNIQGIVVLYETFHPMIAMKVVAILASIISLGASALFIYYIFYAAKCKMLSWLNVLCAAFCIIVLNSFSVFMWKVARPYTSYAIQVETGEGYEEVVDTYGKEHMYYEGSGIWTVFDYSKK